MNFLRSLAEDFTDFLREQPAWSLIYFSVFYLGCTLTNSRMKQFWYDELFTYHMSRLPDWRTIMAALQGGADLNPPPIYFLTRLCHSVFGTGEVATRLPATLGFLLMLVCLYLVLTPRVGRPVAFAVMLFPMVTGAYRWATEARTYGLILGLVAAAAFFWQRAGRSQQPPLWACLGVGLSLSVAVATQAYGVMSIGPFLLAELTRFWRTRETRWRVWLALGLPFAILTLYIPLLPAHNAFALNNAVFQPGPGSLARFYHMLLDPAIFPFIIVLAFSIFASNPGSAEGSERSEGHVLAEEVALAVGFLLVPLAAIVVAVTVTRVFMDRYGLPSILGCTLILAFLLARIPSRTTPAVATFVFGLWCLVGVIKVPAFWSQGGVAVEAVGQLDNLRPDLPLVVSNGLWFLPLSYYSKPGLANRLTYLVDQQAAVRFTGSDVFEVGYPILEKWYGIPGRIERYQEFLSRGKPFLLYGPTNFPLDWVVKKLIADGATVKIVSLRPEGLVCEVTPPLKP